MSPTHPSSRDAFEEAIGRYGRDGLLGKPSETSVALRDRIQFPR